MSTEKRLNLWPETAELKETNYRDPATDEYEYDGTLWAGKHLVCCFEEDCEDAPRLFLDAYNTANECDMLPSELLAKLREAEKTIADLEATCHQMAHTITTFDNPDPA